MPLTDIAAYEFGLKENHLLPSLVNQYRNRRFALDAMRRASRDQMSVRPHGRSMLINLKLAQNPSFRGSREREEVASPGNPIYDEGELTIFTHSSSIEFTVQAEGQSATEKGAFAKVATELMSDMSDAFGDKWSKLLWGDGTGAMGRVQGVVGTTVTLEPDGGASADGTFGGRVFYDGQEISFSTTKTGLTAEVNSNATIQYVDGDDLIVDDATNIVAGQYVYWGSKAETSKNRVMDGFRKGVDDGVDYDTWMAISRASVPKWAGNVKRTMGTGDIETELRTQCNRVNQRSDGRTSVLFFAQGMANRYFDQLTASRTQFLPVSVAGGSTYHGGYEALVWHYDNRSIPIFQDYEVPAGTIWGLDWSTWFMAMQYEPQWLDRGEGIFKPIRRQLGYEAYFFCIGNIGCIKPAANFLIAGGTGV